MNGLVIELDVSQIHDWDSFHDVSSSTFGFPDFYGRNMDAWIDCMTYRDQGDGMASVDVQPGAVITIQLVGYKTFKARCPAIAEALNECVAFVNWSRIETGDAAILCLSYHD